MYRRDSTGVWTLFFLSVLIFKPILLAAAPATAPPAAPAASAVAPELRRAIDAVRADGLRAHVRYLADDLLEGRDTGTPGGLLAARYLAAQLEQDGLKPAGDGGTYFQQVPFIRSHMDLEQSRVVFTRGAETRVLALGDDFLLNGAGQASAHVEAPLAFAGYGITAPEYRYDDYRGLDVKGKVVVLLTGEPESKDAAFFDGEKDTKYAAGGSKIALARSHGAVGVITVLHGKRGAAYPWDRVKAVSGSTSVSLPGDAPTFPAVLVREAGAERIFEGSGHLFPEVRKQIEEGTVKPFPLPGQARIDLAVDVEGLPGPNVAGLLEGSDPELKKQVVVFSAHYDHLGKRGDGDGTIYNGAWDNASGTAAVLETAHGFAQLQPRPRRSMLFLFVTGEEKGLLGSRYYTQHPLVPIEATAANINLDMPEIFGIPRQFVPLGAEHSTLLESCEVVAKQTGLKIGPDPTPELGTFTRSDQFSFAQVGVPCLFLRWSNEYEDLTPEAAKAKWKEKLDTIYHKPADKFDPSWSWEGMRREVQVAVLLGVDIGNRPEMPQWKAKDPFEKPRQTRAVGG